MPLKKPKSPPKKVQPSKAASKTAATTKEVIAKSRANQKELQGMLNKAGKRKVKKRSSAAKHGGKGGRNMK